MIEGRLGVGENILTVEKLAFWEPGDFRRMMKLGQSSADIVAIK